MTLATWPYRPHHTGYEPKKLDKMVPADDDATPINDPDHDSAPDFSKNTRENAGLFGVSYRV